MQDHILVAAHRLSHPAIRARLALPIDPKDLDLTTKPSEDFYQYANGGWLKANPIPADQSSWGSFDEIQDRNEKILHGILERASNAKDPGFIEKLVGDFYASGMDTAAVDSLGSAPLKPEFDRIAAHRDGVRRPGRHRDPLHRIGVGVCFGFGSEQDPKNSERVIAAHGQGGLGLPDRDYYMRDGRQVARSSARQVHRARREDAAARGGFRGARGGRGRRDPGP